MRDTFIQWKARNRAVRTIERELDALAGLAAWTAGEIAGTANGDGSGVSPRDLFVRLIALPPVDARFDAVRLERVPGYREWTRFGSAIAELSARLEEVSGEPRFARSPFRFLAREVAKTENPLTFVSEQLEAAAAPLRTIRTALEGTPFDGASVEDGDESRGLDTLDDIAEAVAFAARLRTLGRGDLVRALDPESEAARALREQSAEIEERTYRWERAKEENDLWRDKLAPRDARDALALAERVEGKFLAFLRPSWRRLRKILRERYDFDSAFVIRTWVQILGDLCAEYDAHDAVEEAVRTAARRFEVEDYSTSIEEWRRLQDEIAELPAASRALLDAAIAGDADTVDRVAELADTLATLESTLDGVWVGGRELPAAEFDAAREALLAQLNSLPDILPSLESLHDASPELHTLLRQEPLLPEEVEALLATKSIDVATRAHREWGEFDGEALAKALRKVHKAYEQWFELNAQWITAGVGAQFREHALLGDTPDAQLTEEERERKKRYKKGRRELEHEFGKTMRHKSIRDLASDESGEVVRDLKPIWLMSPLSVSDTIPLADSDVACDFDVVIFDEASQVPVEEAVPALYRARQTIVVGDEMQLPPTQFFAAAPGDDATLLIEEEEGEVIEFALDADSFLTQSARNLSSTLLGWHYRSRFEALIGFSNAAFYQGRLRTIPDRRLREREFEPLVLETPDAAAERAAPILERSVSFYHLPNAEYVHRRNPDEARTIAELVRQLLMQDTGKSLGIVAFSEAQQGEIERALATLAADDREFRARLDAEEEREEDGQFVGLFVKNLENVQGDERDIVLLSVCYGYDERRKMRMNFGPINKNGGEKRLNVIFSRAKERMVVVSSIRGSDITNDYNDGARCLRNYLFYAEAVSTGEWEEAARVLGEMTLDRADDDRAGATDTVVDSVAAALTERGWEVERDVGQSSFRCDLGVRKEGEPEFRLAVIVDTDRHWANRDRLESFYLRPQVLRAFGWNVAFVLARDWYADRDGAIERLEKELRRRRR